MAHRNNGKMTTVGDWFKEQSHFYAVIFVVVFGVLGTAFLLLSYGASNKANQTIQPSADTFVNAAYSTENFSNARLLRTDGSPVKLSYLKFNVQVNGTVSGAVLRVYPNTNNKSGYTVYKISNGWSASSLNYKNRPVLGQKINTSGQITANKWTSVDVASVVKANGEYSFALAANDNNEATYNSAQSTSDQPQLVVTYSTTTPPGSPTPPTGLTGTDISPSQINLTWNPSSDTNGTIAGYYVFRNGTKIATVTSTSYDNTGLSANTTYSYYVEAYASATSVSSPSSTIQVSTGSGGVQPPPPGSYDVTKYGADPTGQSDSAVAIRKAIAAAQAAGAGNTVYFPAGTYLLNDNGSGTSYNFGQADFDIQNTPVNILGAGRNTTKLVEKVGTVTYPNQHGTTVFVFSKVNGFTFSGLTVDSQTYNAGDPLDDFGSNTTIEHSAFLGGTNTPPNKNVFDLRVIKVCNANPGHNNYGVYGTGNVINDVILNGRGHGGNDDLDFSCEQNGTISNITDTGWGTALYIDNNVTITNYNFTPSTYQSSPPGWYVTASSNITINNFTTSGHGGIINSPNHPSSNITIDGEIMTKPGFNMVIGDANNTVITNSNLSGLQINPQTATNGVSVSASNITQVSCKSGVQITNLVGLKCGSPVTYGGVVPPTNLTGSAPSSTQVNLSWTASTSNSIAHYNVYRNNVVIAAPTGTSYSDTKVSPSTTYTYTVTAVNNSSQESTQSNTVSVTTPGSTGTQPPSAPTGLAGNAVSQTQINLSWNASTDQGGSVAGYYVFRDGSKIATVTTGLSYGDTGLTASTAYKYYVEAFVSASNVSSPSSTISVTTLGSGPPPPNGPCINNAAPATYDHVIWIVEENKGYQASVGSGAAAYWAKLNQQCGAESQAYGVEHPSLPNYIDLTSGASQGINNDGPPAQDATNASSIFNILASSGKTWKTYAETMPSNCYLTDSGASPGQYVVHHNPAPYFLSIRSACQSNDVPFGTVSSGNFISDLNSGNLPNFTIIVPNRCDDMHSCSPQTGDAWLNSLVPTILNSSTYKTGKTAIVILMDESLVSSENNHVPLTFISPSVKAGTVVSTHVNHYAILRTTESMLGITPYPGNANSAPDLRSAFNL